MSIAGLIALVLLGTGWFVKDVFDAGMWALWFAAFDGLVIGYSTLNVVQKKVQK